MPNQQILTISMVAGFVLTVAVLSGCQASGPRASGPRASGPQASGPQASGPQAIDPVASVAKPDHDEESIGPTSGSFAGPSSGLSSGPSWILGDDRDWTPVRVPWVQDEALQAASGRWHGLKQDLDVWPVVLKTQDPIGHALTDQPDTVARVQE